MIFTQEVQRVGQVSDGSHTFDELYYHRMMLFAVICSVYKEHAWKSWQHNDGTMYDDYFIVGVTTPDGDFSYHYHKDWWHIFGVKAVEKAPKWDGHTADDVTRLFSLLGERAKMLTYKEIELKFCERYPNAKVLDYRPHVGSDSITIWLEGGVTLEVKYYITLDLFQILDIRGGSK